MTDDISGRIVQNPCIAPAIHSAGDWLPLRRNAMVGRTMRRRYLNFESGCKFPRQILTGALSVVSRAEGQACLGTQRR